MSRRSYGQNCALAAALDQIGDLWALLIVRELLLGPRRFTDLTAGLPGAGSNTLTVRLKQLEADEIIARAWLPPPAASTVYTLTPRGHALRPIVLGLMRWGAPAIARVPIEHPIRAAWLALALEAFYRPGSVEPGEFEFDLPTGRVVVTVRADGVTASDAGFSASEAEGRVRVTGSEDAILASMLQPATYEGFLASEAIRVVGDPERLGGLLRACSPR